jgi:PiT family inorganic phosphate transporter
MLELTVLIITIALALAYAFSNGINDAANAIALVISTRALTPIGAVTMGAIFNMIGALTGAEVAKTIGKGIVDPTQITQATVIAAVLAAVIWVLMATRLGYPVSVSHSLVASILGAGLATAGPGAIVYQKLVPVLIALGFSPVLGFMGGYGLMLTLYWLLRKTRPSAVRSLFWRLQILAGAGMAYAHGKNDAQNAMGMVALAWAVYYAQDVEGPALWMKLAAGGVMALGVAIGGRRVIRTVGMRITNVQPVHGFAASAAGAAVIEVASNFGLPVSTTHTISTSVMGVGASRRLSAVRWGITRSIGMAWLVTYPVCFFLGLGLSLLMKVTLEPFLS